jgi:hypothetical protein
MPTKEKEKNETILRFVTELTAEDLVNPSRKRYDQRILQCGTGEQYFLYIPEEFIESLGLSKGDTLNVLLLPNHIEIYPQNEFLKMVSKAGVGSDGKSP